MHDVHYCSEKVILLCCLNDVSHWKNTVPSANTGNKIFAIQACEFFCLLGKFTKYFSQKKFCPEIKI